MNRAKNEIVSSIARAKLELDDALEELKGLPMLDPMVLGFIAHALNNYLHVISGTVELLGDALADHPQKQVNVWIKGLRDITPRMANLVNEMQSGPRKAPPQMRFEKIDLATLADRACTFYRRRAARKQIEIAFNTSSPPPPAVRTDRIAVAAILDNLLSNAVKFSAPGKRILVKSGAMPARSSAGCRMKAPESGPRIGRSCFNETRGSKPSQPAANRPRVTAWRWRLNWWRTSAARSDAKAKEARAPAFTSASPAPGASASPSGAPRPGNSRTPSASPTRVSTR